VTHLVLVRHGQTDWNVTERFRGRFDVPLNAVGTRQAYLTARRVAETWDVAAVYSSPLTRALTTAQAIAGALLLSAEVMPELVDMNFGGWEGLTPDEVRLRWPEMHAAWRASPHIVRMPGGESLDDVRQRCQTAIGLLVARHPGQTVVAVAHTDLNRVFLLLVLGMGNDHLWQLGQDNCAINVIDLDGSSSRVVTMNDTCHLQRGVP